VIDTSRMKLAGCVARIGIPEMHDNCSPKKLKRRDRLGEIRDMGTWRDDFKMGPMRIKTGMIL
jgi:hypothetical protein